MYSSAKRRRIKPFARPTAFDTNCAYDIRHYQKVKFGNIVDPYFPAMATDEAFNVLEGEVCMMHSNPGVRRYGDHNMHVFTFANGLQARVGPESKSKKVTVNASGGAAAEGDKAAILRELKYAGVAVTEFKPSSDVFEQGFVVTMGGLNTLFNNGNNTLYPGDTICADIPNTVGRGARKNRALQTGVPREKLQFVVNSYNNLSAEVGPELASRFILGTALSYSRPGNPVDVVLHKCNRIVMGGGAPAAVDADDRGRGRGSGFAPAEAAKPKKKVAKKK